MLNYYSKPQKREVLCDIFGKRAEDYDFMQEAAKRRGVPVDSYNAMSMFKQYDRANRRYKVDLVQTFSTMRRHDTLPAAGFEYTQSNLTAVQAREENILYREFRLAEFFPIKTDIPRWADTYSYKKNNAVGEARFIDHTGSNAQTAQISSELVPYKLQYGGIKATWTRRDLEQAQATGISLDTDTIDSAMSSCMQHIERVGMGTDTSNTFENGLINSPVITILPSTISWATATALEILDQINTWFAFVSDNTSEIYGRTLKPRAMLYLPATLYGYLNRPVTEAGAQSIWEYVRQNNIWTGYTGIPLDRTIVTELATAGGGGTSRIIIGYPDSTETWEMGMSIPPEVIQIREDDFNFVAPLNYAVSGLNIKRNGALLYIDGA